MDALGVAVTAVLGAGAGWVAGPVADALAAPRYGPDADGHDPEDTDLAPMAVPVSTRARVVLAILGTVGGALLARPFDTGDVVLLLGVLGFAYLVAMTVDLQYLRLPNVCTYPAAIVAVGGTLVLSSRHDLPWSPAVVGAVGYSVFLLVARTLFALVRGVEGMGLGDVKLAVSLGATLGWVGGIVDPVEPVLSGVRFVILAALLANLSGALIGLVLVRRLDKAFPFGPYLVAAWLVILASTNSLAP